MGIGSGEWTRIPSHREGKALEAQKGFGKLWLFRARAPREYPTCYRCPNPIKAHQEHVVLRYLFPNRRGLDHHHLHVLCAERDFSRELIYISVVPFSRVPASYDTKEAKLEIHRLGAVKQRKPRSKKGKRYK